MDTLLATVEFEPEMKSWLEWFSHKNELPFSMAMHHILEQGRQAAENDNPTLELPKAQKLLIQCVMESWLILKDAHVPSAELRQALGERARTTIRKTLGLPETNECLSS